jgi:hypothetical protein
LFDPLERNRRLHRGTLVLGGYPGQAIPFPIPIGFSLGFSITYGIPPSACDSYSDADTIGDTVEGIVLVRARPRPVFSIFLSFSAHHNQKPEDEDEHD